MSARSSKPFGLWTAAALVVGHTIAVGIFLTPAELIGALASPALTFSVWIFCGALVLAGAFTFGELASRYPRAGGPYVYLREAWGERSAFLYGWQCLLVMDPGVTAALALGASQYLVLLWPGAAGAERWMAVGAIWLLAFAAMSGLTLSARVLGMLTAFKLLALAAVVIIAFTMGEGDWSRVMPSSAARSGSPPLAEALAIGLMGAFFSFGGFWEASRVAGEVRDPRRTMPAALALGVSCVTIVYLATTAAFMYLVPASEIGSASDFANRAGQAMLGPAGPAALAAIVVLSVMTSILALLIMAPRLYLAMGRDGLFPAPLASVDGVTRAPVRATAMLALLASLFALVGTFQQVVALFICPALAFIALAASALLALRRRNVRADAFRAPGYPLTTWLFVLLVTAVVIMIAVNRPLEALTGFGLVLLGLPAHALLRLRRRRMPAVATGVDP